jgi:hypothetical protein
MTTEHKHAFAHDVLTLCLHCVPTIPRMHGGCAHVYSRKELKRGEEFFCGNARAA